MTPEEFNTFVGFPKMPRLFREMVITEKIDGTNAAVYISDAGEVRAASRNRFITPQADNYNFAKWVEANKEQLVNLGPGIHYGEYWGQGIQDGYGLTEKRFSLFNTGRWHDAHGTNEPSEKSCLAPACCYVVPVLHRGPFSTEAVTLAIENLRVNGSKAAPGWMKPEGVVVFHEAGGHLYKITCENDEKPKGQVQG